jgi:DNA topoisomerase-1
VTTLVLVESPNKVKKLAHYLGPGFDVLATVGHVRDLPAHDLGVDLATFRPTYEVLETKKSIVSRIKAAAAKAGDVLLATDPDREGEAISWHVAQILRLKNPRRLTYQEITEKALKAALGKVRPLDQARVDSQQARRVLDRLVGYQVSPLLRPFGANHSAGRVQSAVLHAIVQRELERERFKPEPYWTLAARYAEGFKARYATLDDEGRLADTRVKTEGEAEAIAARARGPHEVAAVETADRERKPRPPLTTAELLKLAGSKLGMKLDETMRLAQALFEGGAITYHRTDSVALSDDAIAMARDFIAKDYPEALPSAPPRYKAAANAQEAHEAIRPTSLDPALAAGLPEDQRALFQLIRQAFLASQCKPAVIAQTVVTITSGDTTWRAVGSTVKFPSFLRYLDPDEPKEGTEGPEPKLPPLAPGQLLTLEGVEVARQETKPPPRYTEASIIEFMKRTGIGRPSTYAATIAVLFRREYIALEKKKLAPTPRGRLVDEVLSNTFPDLLEPTYTAEMEDRLDEVAAGKRPWLDELRAWYGPFDQQLGAAPARMAAHLAAHPELAAEESAAPKPTGRSCPRCGAELLLRQRRKGPGAFLSCSAYPKCDYAADPSAKASERACPKCNGTMEETAGKFGPYARCLDPKCDGRVDLSPMTKESCPLCDSPMRDKGTFLSCSRFPECKGSYDKAALAKARRSPRTCPSCGHLLLERRSAKGKFLGCSAYPKCRFIDTSSGAPSTARRDHRLRP